jgi:hypothetical protein
MFSPSTRCCSLDSCPTDRAHILVVSLRVAVKFQIVQRQAPNQTRRAAQISGGPARVSAAGHWRNTR